MGKIDFITKNKKKERSLYNAYMLIIQRNFMKLLLTMFIFLSFSFILSGCDNNKNENIGKTSNNENSINISKTSTDNNSTQNQNKFQDENNLQKENTETELASFSTPLKSGVANRIVNIKLTCEKINGYTLKNGETFSFNNLIGPCTAEEGYKEAEIYVNKQIKYALGGGNCQVSTTLYNAALAVPGITIVERHEHGKSVDYIQDGKDATVSYNTLDLKFKNETGNDLKLYASCDDVNVYAKICK